MISTERRIRFSIEDLLAAGCWLLAAGYCLVGVRYLLAVWLRSWFGWGQILPWMATHEHYFLETNWGQILIKCNIVRLRPYPGLSSRT